MEPNTRTSTSAMSDTSTCSTSLTTSSPRQVRAGESGLLR
ncbi:hypothetical protein BC739_001418 [Kutzneria viridogrisea]|uniref:Uncharacterized protein n=2 Tax=Kutzneria TaxID=43356 RepID=W5WC33_9PSEU|nr:hypothetical protein KALB_4734 [Kutzneria albida DSM 43870]MBA8924221.1 hypothetical protein [Kutzneria viridogrisea]